MEPIIIHNEEEYDQCADELFELTAKENPTSREEAYIEVLTDAIVAWDNEHYPTPEPSERTKMLISDALGPDKEKARKAMTELNWYDADEDEE
jgi:antitoxin component HigA of HigAB toxin-antitoxin module